jgi:hypothetical protein
MIRTSVTLNPSRLYTPGGNDYGALGTGSHKHVTYDLPIRIKIPVDAAAATVAAAAAAAAEMGEDASSAHAAGEVDSPRVTVVQLVIGYAHMLARTDSGGVYTWGCNLHGQLGLGDHKDRAAPSLVSYLSEERVVAVAVGLLHSFAVTDAGELYAWGFNRDYQLGLGDVLDRVLPTRVTGALDGLRVTSVDGGGFHSLAVTSKGDVFSFGHNRWGQAGVDPEDSEGRGTPSESRVSGGSGGSGAPGGEGGGPPPRNYNLAPVASGGVGVTVPTRVLLPASMSDNTSEVSVAAAAVAAGTWQGPTRSKTPLHPRRVILKALRLYSNLPPALPPDEATASFTHRLSDTLRFDMASHAVALLTPSHTCRGDRDADPHLARAAR